MRRTWARSRWWSTADGGYGTHRVSTPPRTAIKLTKIGDGEWGGVQFRVSNATKRADGSAVLQFSEGGYQQARGASLAASDSRAGNRFYLEGSLDFLDAEGEWHYDRRTRRLRVLVAADPGGLPLVLTQTDRVLSFEGTGTAERVAHVRVANLTLAHTSAQFFLPHEETSGGDYAITRSGAIFAENTTGLVFADNVLEWIGGNAVFLSNSVRSTSVLRNRLSYVGTSGVLVVGRTGHAMMDARDGEALGEDNGVRLPRGNVVKHNVISDYGVWDKQSAAFHRALAPGNEFSENVVFNCSRHGVNFQDSMGGATVARQMCSSTSIARRATRRL